MEGGVQHDAVTVTRAGLDGTGHRVAQEEQVALARQLAAQMTPAPPSVKVSPNALASA